MVLCSCASTRQKQCRSPATLLTKLWKASIVPLVRPGSAATSSGDTVSFGFQDRAIAVQRIVITLVSSNSRSLNGVLSGRVFLLSAATVQFSRKLVLLRYKLRRKDFDFVWPARCGGLGRHAHSMPAGHLIFSTDITCNLDEHACLLAFTIKHYIHTITSTVTLPDCRYCIQDGLLWQKESCRRSSCC